MIAIEMPDPPIQDLVLTPKADSFRGTAPGPEAREPLRNRVSIGGPVHRRIDADLADTEQLRFLREEAADSDFYLLHLTCTLHPVAEEPFTEALIELDLTNADNTKAPIAWSMHPDQMVDTVEVSRTVSLGPALKIFGVGVNLTGQQQRSVTKREIFVEALYELESTPSWGLYRTSSSELRGLFRFHLVVRAPKRSMVSGTTSVQAKVQRKRFGVIPYNADVADAPLPLNFKLGSPAT